MSRIQMSQTLNSISEVCQTHRVNVRKPLYLWSTSNIDILHLYMRGPFGVMYYTYVFQIR